MRPLVDHVQVSGSSPSSKSTSPRRRSSVVLASASCRQLLRASRSANSSTSASRSVGLITGNDNDEPTDVRRIGHGRRSGACAGAGSLRPVMATVWVIVVAAGAGRRFGGRKQYEPLGGRRVARLVAARRPPRRPTASWLVVRARPGRRRRAGRRRGRRPAGPPGRARCGPAWRRCPATPRSIVVHDARPPAGGRGAVRRGWSAAVAAGADAAVPGGAVTDTLRERSAADRSTATAWWRCRRRRRSGPRPCARPTPPSPRPPTTRRWSRPRVARWSSWTARPPTSRSPARSTSAWRRRCSVSARH